jgi:hypothetical protein
VLAPLRWIVERLLGKDPAERYDFTRDFIPRASPPTLYESSKLTSRIV